MFKYNGTNWDTTSVAPLTGFSDHLLSKEKIFGTEPEFNRLLMFSINIGYLTCVSLNKKTMSFFPVPADIKSSFKSSNQSTTA